MRRSHSPKGLCFLMLLGLFAWWVRYHPPGVDFLVFDDDARQHVYWTAKFQDPELFREDLLTEFISSPMMDPPGYQFIYRLGTELLDPLSLSQLISLLLLMASLWLLELWCRSLIPHSGGRFFLQILFLFFSLYASSGGFPRGFAFPLLIGFLALLQRGASAWGGLMLVLEALLYPPILLNTLAMAVLWVMGRLGKAGKETRLLKDTAFLAGGFLVSVALLVSVYASSQGNLFGPQVSPQDARAMPEFQEVGRSAFFRGNTLEFLLLGRSGIGAEYLIGFGIILAAMALLGGVRVIRLPSQALHLCWTSLLLFGMAHILLFKLHLPSRYTIYTLPLAFMLVIGASAGPFLEAAQGLWIRHGGRSLLRSLRSRWVAGGVLGGVMVVYAWAQGHVILRFDTQMVALDRTQMEMLEFLRGLPKGTMVAAQPLDADNVPLVSLRKVLANQELSLPYQIGYYREVRQRIFDLFGAYYARDWVEIEEFVKKYGIGALVVNKTHFTPSFLQGRIYFEPFHSFVKGRIEGAEEFALLAPPREKVCFENARFLVLCWQGKGER